MAASINRFYINSLAEVQLPDSLREYEDIENVLWSLNSENFNDIVTKCKTFITDFHKYSYTLNVLSKIIQTYPDEPEFQNLFELLLKDFSSSGYKYIPIKKHIIKVIEERDLLKYCNNILNKGVRISVFGKRNKPIKYRKSTFLTEAQIEEHLSNPDFDINSDAGTKVFLAVIYWKNIGRFNYMLQKGYKSNAIVSDLEVFVRWGTTEMITTILKRHPLWASAMFLHAIEYHKNDVADMILQNYKIKNLVSSLNKTTANLRGIFFLLLNGLTDNSKPSFINQFAVANLFEGLRYIRQFRLDYDKTDCICLAILFDSFEAFEALIDMGARCYQSTPTPIYLALSKPVTLNYIEILAKNDYIAKCKCNVPNCTSYITYAIRNNLCEHAKILIKYSSLQDITDSVVFESFRSLEYIKLLEKKGCRIKDKIDCIPKNANPDAVRYLIEKGYISDIYNIEDVFRMFVQANDLETLKKIKLKAPNSNYKISSIENASKEMVKWLIDNGVKFDEKILSSAFKTGDFEIFKLLYDIMPHYDLIKIISDAVGTCNPEIIDYVLSDKTATGYHSKIYNTICRNNHSSIGFKIAFEKFKYDELKNINEIDKCFGRALDEQDVCAAFTLLDNYDNISDKPGLLQKACLTGSGELVEALINRDFKAIDTSLPHPMNAAVKFGNIKMIKLLLDNGYSINGYDKFDAMSPLYVAISQKMYDVASFLLANNAKPIDYKAYFSETEFSPSFLNK